jgi:hypothetical protein
MARHPPRTGIQHVEGLFAIEIQRTARSESGAGKNFGKENAQPRVSEHTGLRGLQQEAF